MTKITKTALERKRAAAIEAEDREALAKQVDYLDRRVRHLTAVLWVVAKDLGGSFMIPKGVMEEGVPAWSSIVTSFDADGNMVFEARVGDGAPASVN